MEHISWVISDVRRRSKVVLIQFWSRIAWWKIKRKHSRIFLPFSDANLQLSKCVQYRGTLTPHCPNPWIHYPHSFTKGDISNDLQTLHTTHINAAFQSPTQPPLHSTAHSFLWPFYPPPHTETKRTTDGALRGKSSKKGILEIWDTYFLLPPRKAWTKNP